MNAISRIPRTIAHIPSHLWQPLYNTNSIHWQDTWVEPRSDILSGTTLAAELYNNDSWICCIQIDTNNKVYKCISYVQGVDVCKYASAEERTTKKQKMTFVPWPWPQLRPRLRPRWLSIILVLQSKYTNFRARFAHCYCGSAIIEMPSWECHLRCAIAVEAHRRRVASASIYIYM